MDDAKFWVEVIVNAGGMGGLLFFIYLLIHKIMPDHAAEMKEQRISFLDYLDERDDKFGEVMTVVSNDIREQTKIIARVHNQQLIDMAELERRQGSEAITSRESTRRASR